MHVQLVFSQFQCIFNSVHGPPRAIGIALFDIVVLTLYMKKQLDKLIHYRWCIIMHGDSYRLYHQSMTDVFTSHDSYQFSFVNLLYIITVREKGKYSHV